MGRRFGLPSAWLALPIGLTACTVGLDLTEEAAQEVRAQDIGDLPYHPLVFHLDLSILAYQLYSQSLVWPFDPYYEELDHIGGARDRFMDLVQDWATHTGRDQVQAATGLQAIRGPGRLGGFADNPDHDPILYQYSRLHPWSHSITNDIGQWIDYRTPPALTDPIAEVHVCTRPTGKPEGTYQLDTLVPGRVDAAAGARDVLMVFEGGTGDKGEPGQPVSQSLMGLALLRFGDDDVYDLHIAFRGSRSGSSTRAALEAVSTDHPTGNPDWITDLGVRPVPDPTISTVGEVARGVARSVGTVLPTLFGCLDEVGGRVQPTPPARIFVTGHSLGGGLAQQFTSAVVQGSAYGPGGDRMPASLAAWPWAQAKLITYGAPRVGSETWAHALSEDHLASAAFSARYAYDGDAISVLDADILPRLADTTRGAAYRVLVPTDPITNSYLVTGAHVGQTVYLAEPRDTSPPDTSFHEPEVIRAFMVDTLRDPDRLPASAWRYVALETWSPDRQAEQAGTPAEYDKLIEANAAYYATRGLWFDDEAFSASVQTFHGLLDRL